MVVSSAVDIVTNAYLAITQVAAQGSVATKSIGVNCSRVDGKQACLDCLNTVRTSDTKIDYENIRKLCVPMCECRIENVDMSQNLNYNFSTSMDADLKTKFTNEVVNNFKQVTKQTGDTFVKDSSKSVMKSAENIFENMQTGSFQSSLQAIVADQNLFINGRGLIRNVSLDESFNVISKLVASSDDLADDLTALESTIMEASTQVAQAGLGELISWIVRIFFLSFMISLAVTMILLALQLI